VNHTEIRDDLIRHLHEYEDARPRSRQTALGPSSLLGCRAEAWHRLNGTEPTNRNLMLPASMGSAIHDRLAAMYEGDPDVITNLEVERDGIVGHIDYWNPKEKLLLDYKTTTKKGMASFGTHTQQWAQVNVYAWMLGADEGKVTTVGLIGIPRDGTENDIRVTVDGYSPALVEQALAWREQVQQARTAPWPERSRRFCAMYCPFYGVCPGRDSR
jgi:PD-(D/E)XK nuclease superfamily